MPRCGPVGEGSPDPKELAELRARTDAMVERRKQAEAAKERLVSDTEASEIVSAAKRRDRRKPMDGLEISDQWAMERYALEHGLAAEPSGEPVGSYRNLAPHIEIEGQSLGWHVGYLTAAVKGLVSRVNAQDTQIKALLKLVSRGR